MPTPVLPPVLDNKGKKRKERLLDVMIGIVFQKSFCFYQSNSAGE